MDDYLRSLEHALRLEPEHTRAILTEVRGNIEDLTAHLHENGHDRVEAERLALARFGSPRALARSLRRAHGRAPWPLRALAWPLFVVGLLGLALVAVMGQSLLWIATHDPSSYFFISLQRSGTAFFPAMTNWIRPLAPLLILAACAVGSLLLGARVLRGGLRRWRLVAACLGLLTVVDGAAIVVFSPLLLPRHLVNPASWAMPDLAPLARAGLVSSPDPQQPASPIRVDLVATSPAGTYVVYTISDPLHAGEGWVPLLFDARGTAYPSEGGGSTYTSGPLSLLPWRPAAKGFMRFPPLPPGTRTAVLRFWRPGDQALGTEVVHVSLHLGALATVRVARPAISTRMQGITVRVERVSNGPLGAELTYRISSPPARPVSDARGVILNDARGRALSLTPLSAQCGEGLDHGSTCTISASFAPQPRGGRLRLTIREMGLFPPFGGISVGPWRVAIPMP